MSTTYTTGTSDPPPQADRLRQEMRTIRRELGDNVEELVEHAEQLMDWRYYVRRYPWASLGVAALVGYFVVPQRVVTLPTDDQTLSRLADRLPIHPPTSQPKKQRSSMLNSLISMGTGLALRAATAYLTQQVGKVVAQQTTPHPVETPHE
jgi:hypothetical protein